MQAGQPDRESETEPQASLGARLAASLRGPAGARELAAAVAVLIALGPLATIAGAKLLTAQARGEAARLQSEQAPRLAADLAAERARIEMASALRRPSAASTLDALARGLPADATLVSAARTAQGVLEVEVTTPDPDALRATLRRDPALTGLRDMSQRQAETAMIVSLRQDAP